MLTDGARRPLCGSARHSSLWQDRTLLLIAERLKNVVEADRKEEERKKAAAKVRATALPKMGGRRSLAMRRRRTRYVRRCVPNRQRLCCPVRVGGRSRPIWRLPPTSS